MTHRLIIILSIQCLLFFGPVWAEEIAMVTDQVNMQDNQVKKTVSDFKNPFLSPFYAKPVKSIPHKKAAPIKKAVQKPVVKIVKAKPPVVDVSFLKNLKLSGVVWGGEQPQAIINGQIVGVGDVIEKAKVTSITQKGVQIVYQGVKITLTVGK